MGWLNSVFMSHAGLNKSVSVHSLDSFGFLQGGRVYYCRTVSSVTLNNKRKAQYVETWHLVLQLRAACLFLVRSYCWENDCEHTLLMGPSSLLCGWCLSDPLRTCSVCMLCVFSSVCVSMWNLRCLAGSLPTGQSYDEQLSTRATL